MPELPEVEVLKRHLASRLASKRVEAVRVLDPRSLRRTTGRQLRERMVGARLKSVGRRGKYLLVEFHKGQRQNQLLVHLGMTGRLYLTAAATRCSKHARVRFRMGTEDLVFEDMRCFGGISLDESVLNQLGPEPLEEAFTLEWLTHALTVSKQAVKVRLLDQKVAAGVGNIYACEALFQAGIDPRTPSHQLGRPQLRRLHTALRKTLASAIRFGSALSLDFRGGSSTNGLFYYGLPPRTADGPVERFQVYDREGHPCRQCRTAITRVRQMGRSTYLCENCQVSKRARPGSSTR